MGLAGCKNDTLSKIFTQCKIRQESGIIPWLQTVLGKSRSHTKIMEDTKKNLNRNSERPPHCNGGQAFLAALLRGASIFSTGLSSYLCVFV